jgi:hypothetical protein
MKRDARTHLATGSSHAVPQCILASEIIPSWLNRDIASGVPEVPVSNCGRDSTVNPRQSELMKQKIALKYNKKLRKQINGEFNNIVSADKNKKKYHYRAFI